MRADGAADQRVAIGGRARHGLHANRAAGTGAVVDHHRLLERGRQLVADHAGHDVGRATRREGHDPGDGLGAGPVGCEGGSGKKAEAAAGGSNEGKTTVHGFVSGNYDGMRGH
ncbi:hypothetical protein D3C71_1881870 [compost metagenome]